MYEILNKILYAKQQISTFCRIFTYEYYIQLFLYILIHFFHVHNLHKFGQY